MEPISLFGDHGDYDLKGVLGLLKYLRDRVAGNGDVLRTFVSCMTEGKVK